jgi:hypothetical protein
LARHKEIEYAVATEERELKRIFEIKDRYEQN